jgi:hypothetical protein
MKARGFFLIQLCSCTLLLLVFDIFYPTLNFLQDIDMIEEFLIRFLASYCYIGNFYNFAILFTINLILSLIIGFIILRWFSKEFNRYVFQWIGLMGIFTYFFWIFSNNPSAEDPAPRLLLDGFFAFNTFWFFFSNILLFLILWLGRKIILYYNPVHKKEIKIPTLLFECPHCKTIFHSKISYCSICKKDIKLFADNSEDNAYLSTK